MFLEQVNLVCTVSKDGNVIDNHLLAFQVLDISDVETIEVILVTYTTEGITGITDFKNDYLDVAFDGKSKEITVKLTEAYGQYEENHVEPKFSTSFSLVCPDSQPLDMGFIVNITDTDNHEPMFNQSEKAFTLPMPFPAGWEITRDYDIWAYDFDYTSQLEISFEEEDAYKWLDLQISDLSGKFWEDHNQKTFKEVHIISKEQLTQEELKYTLLVRDKGNPDRTNSLPITITRNATGSIPDSPVFKKPLYRTSVTYEMEAGTVLNMDDEAIGFKNQDIGSIDVTLMEGDNDLFSITKTSQGVEITLIKPVTDMEIRNSLLTLEAKISKAKQPGYTVVYIEFPAYVCPTTTAEPTTQCPTEPPTTTTTPETTVDPCSLCPVSTCPPCPTDPTTTTTTPETTVDPCSLCPQQTCPTVCPSTESTPVSQHTSDSHSNPTDHTTSSAGTLTTGHGSDGTAGTTTPGSSHSKTTSSSWFSHSTPSGTSSTCECDCSNCPQVCPSTESTPVSQHTSDSHSNPTDHTTSSAGTLTTGHGSDGTAGTTTPGSSHSKTTSSSWFSHSTPSGTSSTCECDCSNCPQTTSESQHTSDSHSSPTDHTTSSARTHSTGNGSDGTPGTTTPGSGHNKTTASSWFSSTPSGSGSTSACICPTPSEVASTHTTTDDHHTANSHYSSEVPTHQTRSSRGTLSTGHGSSMIPGSTTPGLSSPSQGGTTISSWFSHSTTSGSSSTMNCNCPETSCTPCNCGNSTTPLPLTTTPSRGTTCTPCPECPVTTATPPRHGYLTFPVDNFVKQIVAGDIGHISWVKAQPHPSDIINGGAIKYQLEDDDDLKGALEITNDGELISRSAIIPDTYSFSVTAQIPEITNITRAKFTLIVTIVEFCENGTDAGIIFPYGFISTEITENFPKTVQTFRLPKDFDCWWAVVETPDTGKVHVQEREVDIDILVDPIDREDEIFRGATTPEVLAEIYYHCKKVNESHESAFSNEDEVDLYDKHNTLVVLIHVHDMNDWSPEFDSDKMVVGYPEQEIADKERPPYMGVATAHDKDVGENAVITYSIAETVQVLIDSESGHFYPHPNYFKYENISFNIIASDKEYATVLDVMVKILSAEYITVLGIEGAKLENVPKLTKWISDKTGLQIGVISAQVEKVNLKKEKLWLNSYFLAEEIVSNSDDFGGINAKDDTLFLRLVIYAINGSEPVSVDHFISLVHKVGVADSHWKLQDYRAAVGAASASNSGSEGLLAAVIALSTILGLLVLGTAAFVAYRKRRGAGGSGSGSLEKGLVYGDSGSDNSSIVEGKDNNSIVFESDTNKVDKDEIPDEETLASERKKSVAFAEEPEVIPSEEELEAMPAEEAKNPNFNDALEDEDDLQVIRM